MSILVKRFAAISKVEDNGDGTIQVFGVASTEGVDAQGETVTKGAMSDALPDYFAHGTGALRVMHQPIAAGFVTKAEVNAAGETEITATVVDPVEVLKVQTGVYKGFSIGGKKLPGGYDAATKTISKMKLTEISLVDRPANPEAIITMFKADSDEVVVPAEAAAAVDELATLLDSGSVTPQRLVELVKAEQAVALTAAPVPEVAKADKKDDEEVDPKAKVDDKDADPKTDKKKKANPFAKFEATGTIEKGMYSVSRMSELLQSIGYLVCDSEWEAESEKDGSTVPAQLKDWLVTGATIFEALAAEEVAEFVAQYKPAAVVEVIALSDAATTLRKSLTDAAAVSLVDFLTIGKAHMGENDIAKAVMSDGFEKATDAIVAKLAPGADTIAKLAAAEDTIAKVTAEMDVVKAELTALKAKPAPSNAVLRVVVAKGLDVVDPSGSGGATDGPILKADGSIDGEATAMQEIKKLHNSGGQPLRSFNQPL